MGWGEVKNYLITFSNFQSILAVNLTPSQIKEIKMLRDGITSDDYGGYSPSQQKLYRQIKKVIGRKMRKFEGI
jgi:hypothetical protein